MIPELLYEIYKYIAPEEYLKLKDTEISILTNLVNTFRDPIEARYIYANGLPINAYIYFDEIPKRHGLENGLMYIATTNPTYSWTRNGWFGKQTIDLFFYAAEINHVKLMEKLLNDARVDPSIAYCESDQNTHSETLSVAVHYGINSGHVTMVDLLLKDGRIDPTADSIYAITSAVARDKTGFMVSRLLEDDRIDPSFKDNLPIKIALTHKNYEVVKLLYQDTKVNESLSDELRNRCLEVIRLLSEEDRSIG